MAGWWYTYPSEKYEFVGWDDDIPNLWKMKTVPNHQPDGIFFRNEPRKMGIPFGYLTYRYGVKLENRWTITWM